MKKKPWLVYGAIGMGAVAVACGSDDDGGGGGGQGKEVDPSDNASTTIAPFAVWAVRASD